MKFNGSNMANPNREDYQGLKVVANGRDGYIARDQDGTTDIPSENLVYDESAMHKVNICCLLVHSVPPFILLSLPAVSDEEQQYGTNSSISWESK